jgi:glycerate-2-kinase
LHVKNFSQLTTNSIKEESLALRRIGLNALELALNSVKAEKLIKKAVKIINDKLIIHEEEFDLSTFREILVIGGGKASAQMAQSIEELLNDCSKIDFKGLVNIPDNIKLKKHPDSRKIGLNLASHPIPDEGGLSGTKLMYNYIEKTTKDDLIIFLLSGGGSALLPMPDKSLSLQDLKITNSLLLASGASIHEINTVRRHLSDFKGGKLAKKIYDCSKATVISLIISDVVGNKLESIASGPTIPDLTTIKDANAVLEKYHLKNIIPFNVKQLIEIGISDPKLNEPLDQAYIFENVHNYLIGSVESSVTEITHYLEDLGFEVEYFTNEIVGEAATYGKGLHNFIAEKLEKFAEKSNNRKLALIGTGELTVSIKGKGIGGRNQEMLLSYLNNVKNRDIDYNVLIIGANLDGIEGNSDAMGALVDNVLLTQVVESGVDLTTYLAMNDSNNFFKSHNCDIITGATGINVNDLILILIDISS